MPCICCGAHSLPEDAGVRPALPLGADCREVVMLAADGSGWLLPVVRLSGNSCPDVS